MASPYLDHFHSFITIKLQSPESTFTTEDMVAWVQKRDSTRDQPQHVKNIVDHLMKRVVNYKGRDDFDPPSTVADDLFFQLDKNLFRRYVPEKDGPPFRKR
jgi:hypothetical protein